MTASAPPLLGRGGVDVEIEPEEQRALLASALVAWGTPRRLLIVAPDATRRHSGAGELTAMLYAMLAGSCEVDILPALGTHAPMSAADLASMYPGVPADRFRIHRWREDVIRAGQIESEFIAQLSEGRMTMPATIEVNRLVMEGHYDLIISIGQVVPHEVAGMANHNKNILIGAGGPDLLGKSHYLGAVYGMERIMGRADTPVRRLLDEAERRALAHLPIRYIQTVIARNAAGAMVMRGLYLGAGKTPYLEAARLAQQVNIVTVEKPIQKAVVYLGPEYKTTWLGNKAIYRLRMAIADGGELLILAPGVRAFGEDPRIDALIRAHGYRGTPATVHLVEEADIQHAKTPLTYATYLAAMAHLIHGSSEGRFTITYAPGHLSREEIESVGYEYAELAPLLRRYDPAKLREGLNSIDGEEIYYVGNPGLGLWTAKALTNSE